MSEAAKGYFKGVYKGPWETAFDGRKRSLVYDVTGFDGKKYIVGRKQDVFFESAGGRQRLLNMATNFSSYRKAVSWAGK